MTRVADVSEPCLMQMDFDVDGGRVEVDWTKECSFITMLIYASKLGVGVAINNSVSFRFISSLLASLTSLHFFLSNLFDAFCFPLMIQSRIKNSNDFSLLFFQLRLSCFLLWFFVCSLLALIVFILERFAFTAKLVPMKSSSIQFNS